MTIRRNISEYITIMNKLWIHPQKKGEYKMQNANVQRICGEISELSTPEKLFLISKILPELSREPDRGSGLDIYDIKGLGKKIWKDMDAQEYVNGERDSWD